MSKINLIGIAGRMSSGKDLTSSIIQYLISFGGNIDNFTNDVATQWLNNPKQLEEFSNWKVVKFAAKLKQIVSILTGISVKDLEKEEVKSSYLGEEWNRWQCRVQIPCINEGVIVRTDVEYVIFTDKQEAEYYYKIAQEYNTNECSIPEFVPITVRQALQWIGTDLFRDKFHPNTWINALFADYKPYFTEKAGYAVFGSYSCKCSMCGRSFASNNKHQTMCLDHYTSVTPNWIISDLRFPNEFQAIKDRGGICIRVHRSHKNNDLHSSETASDSVQFDYIIDNTEDIPHLINEVKKMLIHFKII